jgi:hypothetical protein
MEGFGPSKTIYSSSLDSAALTPLISRRRGTAPSIGSTGSFASKELQLVLSFVKVAVAWEKVVDLLAVNRLIAPRSELSIHKKSFSQTAMAALLVDRFTKSLQNKKMRKSGSSLRPSPPQSEAVPRR